VITPRIVGHTVGLSEIWVLVALFVGGELFGFLGVLLAVPAAAVAKIFVAPALRYYRRTALFRDVPPAGGPDGHPARHDELADARPRES
jgi:predicted PurR-regulated permease PerM